MLLAHLVTGRYSAQYGEGTVSHAAAPAKTGWFSRLIGYFSHRR